jgi:four helix bundle protein
MTIRKFEDLRVWQASMALAQTIITFYGKSNKRWIANQILRSAISIPSNIAEGFDRRTNNEFIQFLGVARGSCAELRTQLMLDRNSNNDFEELEHSISKSKEISAMLSKLIHVRKTQF